MAAPVMDLDEALAPGATDTPQPRDLAATDRGRLSRLRTLDRRRRNSITALAVPSGVMEQVRASLGQIPSCLLHTAED